MRVHYEQKHSSCTSQMKYGWNKASDNVQFVKSANDISNVFLDKFLHELPMFTIVAD